MISNDLRHVNASLDIHDLSENSTDDFSWTHSCSEMFLGISVIPSQSCLMVPVGWWVMGSSLLGNFFIETDQKLTNFSGFLPVSKIGELVLAVSCFLQVQHIVAQGILPKAECLRHLNKQRTHQITKNNTKKSMKHPLFTHLIQGLSRIKSHQNPDQKQGALWYLLQILVGDTFPGRLWLPKPP